VRVERHQGGEAERALLLQPVLLNEQLASGDEDDVGLRAEHEVLQLFFVFDLLQGQQICSPREQTFDFLSVELDWVLNGFLCESGKREVFVVATMESLEARLDTGVVKVTSPLTRIFLENRVADRLGESGDVVEECEAFFFESGAYLSHLLFVA